MSAAKKTVIRRLWTASEEEQLRTLYPDTPGPELALLFSRPLDKIYSKAARLCLKKSLQYLASPHACRLRRGDNVGAAYRYPKGHVPANKGTRRPGWHAGNMKATQFKPGQMPRNWQPLGAERLSKEGYRQRKMTDTGYPPRDWVPVHWLLWIEHNGPIPSGHKLVFRDGNKEHIALDNLELITNADMMRRNSIHRYPPALKQVIRAAGKLNRMIEAAHAKQD